jgi:hypothetical protein
MLRPMTIKQRLSPRGFFTIFMAVLLFALLAVTDSADADPMIVPDAENKLVTLSDGNGQLILRLNYNNGVRLDQVKVRGREVVGAAGVSTGVLLGDQWFTAKTASAVAVKISENSVTIQGISFGKPGQEVLETWAFTTLPGQIIWQITRQYSGEGTVEDMAFPEWDFSNISTWTGGLLDNGGVVLTKYLDRADATYGGHFGTVTFWNAEANDCLRITPSFEPDLCGAGRFSRQNNDTLSFNYTISDEPPKPKHGQSRFLADQRDLWKQIHVGPSQVTAKFVLQAFNYDKAYDRGTFKGLDG